MPASKNDRPSLGFGETLDTLDLTEFPPAKSRSAKPAPETVRKAAEASGFRSREAKVEVPMVQQRRRRTGRNVQFNIKARLETIEAFTQIADANGWGLGETFERATALLQRENDS